MENFHLKLNLEIWKEAKSFQTLKFRAYGEHSRESISEIVESAY